jgi:hypothetical protein
MKLKAKDWIIVKHLQRGNCVYAMLHGGLLVEVIQHERPGVFRGIAANAASIQFSIKEVEYVRTANA